MEKKKILIIDDDPVILDSLYDLLDSQDRFLLKKTSQGEEGLSLIQIFKPDLVILDVMLPEIDGFEICKKIQKISEESRPKIILLTALTALLNLMESSWLQITGALALVPKPVDFAKLLDQIHAALR